MSITEKGSWVIPVILSVLIGTVVVVALLAGVGAPSAPTRGEFYWQISKSPITGNCYELGVSNTSTGFVGAQVSCEFLEEGVRP